MTPTTEALLFWSGVSFYAAASVLYLTWAVFRREAVERVGAWLALAGLVPHSAAILMRWVAVQHGPYITRYEVFSSDAWVAVALFLLVRPWSPTVRVAGPLVMTASLVMMGYGALSFDARAEAPITFKSWWLIIHILFGKLVTAAMLVAAGLAILYLVRRRRPGVLPRLPADEILEDLSYRFCLLGFLLLGVMIVAGSIWANNAWGRYWGWDPIETWSLISWLAFGVALHLRRMHGWQGPRFASLTVGLLLLSAFAIFGITLLSPTIHASYLVK